MNRTATIHCVIPVLLAAGMLRMSIAEEERAPDADRWQSQVDQLTAALADEPNNVQLYSRRGDARFFLGQFAEAVADYDRMVTLDASLDRSHWRRGIALFYKKQYDAAARQFERYHSFDNVDRENGIWRYLCQVRADGVEKARAGLLGYEKDDREPFGDVYRLFSGNIQPDEIVDRIKRAEVSDAEREKRRFYAHLYIGLWHAVHERREPARPHLKRAVANTWAPQAGYGPRYMWHVGRLHYDSLSR